MIDKNLISKVVNEAIKSGKYVLGARETAKNARGMRAVIVTSSVPKRLLERIEAEAKKQKLHIINANITSVELSRLIGCPYRVSAMAVRSISEADLRMLEK
jgi:large subunit ribosomal protein L30e